jgi:tetratricopeptide (TPR) repeat protein
MGVTLTATAQEELARAAAENHVNAQTALVQGISAQKQGTEVAALSYYFQAAAFDPSLREAVTRSSILNVNISSGNIGEDARNDVAWRRDWVARLSETEQYFDTFNKSESMPYTLFYVSDEIKREGEINYRNETLTMKIETHLHGSGIWTVSMERALQAVYDGLNATKRKDVWGLGNWPQQGVTNLNAFARRSRNFSVVFELLNNQNKVIGRQTLQSGGYWNLNWGRPVVEVNADERKTLYFQNVNVNDITDNLTIQVATVNGTAAETAARNGVLQIRAVTKNEFDENDNYRFSKGTLQGYTNKALNAMADWGRVRQRIPSAIWGDPVISIGAGAFRGYKVGTLTVPDSVISIAEQAFQNNPLSTITIGENVDVAYNAFRHIYSDGSIRSETFGYYYNETGKKAGRYEDIGSSGSGLWKYYTPQDAKARELEVLGTEAYWKKDYATAKAYLEEALQLNPKREKVKDLLKKTNDILNRQAKREAKK